MVIFVHSSVALRQLAHVSCATLVILLMAGCSYNDKMKPTIQLYDQGKFSEAADEVEPLRAEYSLQERDSDGKSKSPINGVVFGLEVGTIQQNASQFQQSLETYQSVWDEISPYLDEKAETKITEEIAAALVNQTLRTYRGTGVDRIMLNTYEALNYFALGQPEKAAVELRRAEQWQDVAVARNQSRIDEETQAYVDAGQKDSINAQQTLDDPRYQAVVNTNYGTIRDMRGYTNYEIPYATYLRGVNRFATGEYEQARTAFKRVAEMLPTPASAEALKDVDLAANAANGQTPPKSVFIFVEAGRAPSLKELRLDVPLFIAGIDGVPYAGVALPLLDLRNEPFVSSFTVNAESLITNSSLLTDMDAVVAQDFNQRFPGIVIATLISSATKVAATYAAKKAFGNLGLLVGVVYQVSTNSADLRCWLTLPKHVLWARVDRPKSGLISLTLSDGRTIGPLLISEDPVTVIRVRTVTAGTEPSVLNFSIPSTR